MSNFVPDNFHNESTMPHGAFAATLSNGNTYDFETFTQRMPSRKVNQYKGTGDPKRAVGVQDFLTADARLQCESATGGEPDDLPALGVTLTMPDGRVWWLESITLNEATATAWTYDTVWQCTVATM